MALLRPQAPAPRGRQALIAPLDENTGSALHPADPDIAAVSDAPAGGVGPQPVQQSPTGLGSAGAVDTTSGTVYPPAPAAPAARTRPDEAAPSPAEPMLSTQPAAPKPAAPPPAGMSGIGNTFAGVAPPPATFAQGPEQMAPATPDPVLANAPTLPAAPPPAPAAPSSQIFAGDPTRPGAGYVNFNGKAYRIEGTTQAGVNPDGTPKAMAGAKYLLDDGSGNAITGPDVNESDYNAWTSGYHGPDGPAPASPTTPPSGAGGSVTPAPGPKLSPNHPASDVPTPSSGIGSGGAVSGATPAGLSPTGPANDAGSPSTSGTGGAPPDMRSLSELISSIMQMGGSNAGPGTTRPSDAQVATGTIDPTNDLRSQVIAPPDATPYSPAMDPAIAAQLGKFSDLLSGAGSNLASVDRLGLARDALKNWSDETDPSYQLALKEAKQAASATGTGYSGILRNSLGDLATQRLSALDQQRKGLTLQALNDSVGDSFNKANTLGSLQSLLSGQGQQSINNNLNAYNTNATTAANNRGELRGERAYQTDASQQALNNRIEQEILRESELNDQFGRGMQLSQFGYGGNPSGTLLDAAGQDTAAGAASGQSAMQLIANALLKSGTAGGGTAGQAGTAPGGFDLMSLLKQYPDLLSNLLKSPTAARTGVDTPAPSNQRPA